MEAYSTLIPRERTAAWTCIFADFDDCDSRPIEIPSFGCQSLRDLRPGTGHLTNVDVGTTGVTITTRGETRLVIIMQLSIKTVELTPAAQRGFSVRFTNRTRLRKLALLTVLALALTGCSQTQHRLNADREAYCTIAERNDDPRWSASDVNIDMDSRSRYFDPYNPDCSPIPVDDPASHRYMHCVDGKKGWKHWGRNGVRSDLENPQWKVQLASYTTLNDENEVELNVDSALRLAYVNSPLHQRSLETLYLTSLDVTGQRFQLDTQFFGGNGIAYRHQGNVTPKSIGFNPLLGRYVLAGPFNRPETNRMTVTHDIQASRRFATAGEVLVGFANSFVFEFTGSDVSLGSSLANFSFVQPLLRGAGRDVALEQLTVSERRLLANLRAYSQFRQGFYTQVVIGELGVEGPQRFGPDTSLQSFSGVGGVSGYLGLLQQAQQIRNTEDNLRLQLRTLDRLEALYENELIDIVQVDQFRQNIERTRANLLDRTNALELAVDNYKTQTLGLPPDLPVDLDEQLVEQFQLFPTEGTAILQSLLELQGRIGKIGELSDLQARLGIVEEQLEDLPSQDFADAERTLRRLRGLVEATGRRLKDLPNDLATLQDADNDDEQGLSELERKSLRRMKEFSEEDLLDISQRISDASTRLERIMDDISDEKFEDTMKANAEWFAEIASLARNIILVQSVANELVSEPELILETIEQFIDPVRELFADAQSDLERLDEIEPQRQRFMNDDETIRFERERERLAERLSELEVGESGLEAAVDVLSELRETSSSKNRTKTIRGLTAWIQGYIQLVERLSLIPAQARLEVIAVDEVELEPEVAFQIALGNRLDFMNGRAALVDRWRAIQVAADALQSDLTITGGGDVRTARNNPLDFRAATGSLRLGIEFDAPLARLLERNGYRESLIEYQRSRRNLIQSQDSLHKGLRALLRTLKQRKLQLEIQRRAVTIALRRVDQTQLSLLTPPPQGQPGARPQINPTTAINLLSAQGSLQTSQNSLLAAWLNYYAARLRLYRELGVMQLDPSGRWIENAVDFGAESQPIEFETLPPAVPIEVLEVDFANQDFTAQADAAETISRTAAANEPVTVELRGSKADVEPDSSGNPIVRIAQKAKRFRDRW